MPSGSGAPKITADFVRDRSIEVREKLGDGVLDSFEEHNAGFIGMLDGLDPAVLDTLTVPLPYRHDPAAAAHLPCASTRWRSIRGTCAAPPAPGYR